MLDVILDSFGMENKKNNLKLEKMYLIKTIKTEYSGING